MKGFLLAAALVGSVTYNVSDSFWVASDSAQNISHIYTVASQIDPYASPEMRQYQEKALYQTASLFNHQATHAPENYEPFFFVQ